ncbi:hypothetical protein BJV82DRAFT_413199 [Fennellomyces sp. T-0311]|nr:hypothetical protein BJV82DRAFT_413199 [Fennellomyces sp. T-0311]
MLCVYVGGLLQLSLKQASHLSLAFLFPFHFLLNQSQLYYDRYLACSSPSLSHNISLIWTWGQMQYHGIIEPHPSSPEYQRASSPYNNTP